MKVVVISIFLFFSIGAWAQVTDTSQVESNTIEERIRSAQQDSLSQQTMENAFAKLDSLGITDSLATAVDTTKKKKFFYRLFKEGYPDPKKAALLSIVPGGGQLYNKKYWKLPIVYAGYAGITYFVISNVQLRKGFNEAYAIKLELTDAPACTTEACARIVASNLSADSVKARRQAQLKQLQLSYIGIFAVVVLTAADAFVDSHLKTFDVDEDLSFKLKPHFDSGSGGFGTNMGMGIVFNF